MKNLLILFTFLALFSCSQPDEVAPVKMIELEGSTWTRLDNNNIYQVFQFGKDGTGRTDYKADKVKTFVEIAAFRYRYNQKSVWVTTDKGNGDFYGQEGVFVDGTLLIGGYTYLREP